jgi:hypothetical protein
VVSITAASTWRGKNWSGEKVKSYADAEVAILDVNPTDQALLATRLAEKGVKPWALFDGKLWPLFHAADAD